jgi:hypothetical protein
VQDVEVPLPRLTLRLHSLLLQPRQHLQPGVLSIIILSHLLVVAHVGLGVPELQVQRLKAGRVQGHMELLHESFSAVSVGDDPTWRAESMAGPGRTRSRSRSCRRRSITTRSRVSCPTCRRVRWRVEGED